MAVLNMKRLRDLACRPRGTRYGPLFGDGCRKPIISEMTA